MAITVTDRPQLSRFELYDGEDLAGFSEYHRHADEIAFLHTEVAPAFAGRGLGTRLGLAALDAARDQGLAVLPYCPFIRHLIREHPGYLDLVPVAQRVKFDL
ncbi:GNAT family N-acetyltransferase [Kitasatospora sp. NPDC059571]|uniref:GNAT family N-acetyltransferase n=1 Tax=Kitasatospora sp. NPDC059571 TaxID=3346871 RepID=UPI0036AAFF91